MENQSKKLMDQEIFNFYISHLYNKISQNIAVVTYRASISSLFSRFPFPQYTFINLTIYYCPPILPLIQQFH